MTCARELPEPLPSSSALAEPLFIQRILDSCNRRGFNAFFFMTTDSREVGWLHVKQEYNFLRITSELDIFFLQTQSMKMPVQTIAIITRNANEGKTQTGNSPMLENLGSSALAMLKIFHALLVTSTSLLCTILIVDAGTLTPSRSTWPRSRMILAMCALSSKPLGNAETVGVVAG
jgi:hypothetical protein